MLLRAKCLQREGGERNNKSEVGREGGWENENFVLKSAKNCELKLILEVKGKGIIL